MKSPSAGVSESDLLGEVPLFLAESPTRGAPGLRIDMGRIRLRPWQVHPVTPMPRDFNG